MYHNQNISQQPNLYAPHQNVIRISKHSTYTFFFIFRIYDGVNSRKTEKNIFSSMNRTAKSKSSEYNEMN